MARGNSEFKALDHCPAVGESAWLHLEHPFAAAKGESFWCLYHPPAFYYAGVDNDDTRITQFAFVRCHIDELEITAIDDRQESGFWNSRKAGIARATVDEVIGLETVPQFPLSGIAPPNDIWLLLRSAGNTLIYRQDAFVYVLCQTVLDWSFWAVLYDTPAATDLLVFCDSGEHDDTVRVGRTRLRDGDKMIGPGVPTEWLNAADNPHHIRR